MAWLDLAPPEEVHGELFCGLVLLVELVDVRLQVDVIQCGRESPEVFEFRCEREGFLDLVINFPLGERFDGPDRLFLTLPGQSTARRDG